MKFSGTCALFVGLLASTFVSIGISADLGLVEEIIAKVNGDIVTRSEIERSRKVAEVEMRQRGLTGARLNEAASAAEKDFLRDRIDQLLLTQKGKELNIDVSAEVSKYLAEIQRENKIADPEKFQQFVREQSGESFEDFKSDTKNGMLTQRVIRQEVGGKINVPEKDVLAYFEAHKTEYVRQEKVYLRQILISTQGKDAAGTAAAEKKAKDLVRRSRGGEKFPELARDNSDDPETGKLGGDIGGWEKGKLMKQAEDLVWTQPRGYVTDPIKAQNGFLILKVDEHQKGGQAEIEDVRNEIMDKLYTPRMQPAVREYLTKLRKDAFLEIKPGFVDSGAAAGKDTTWSDPAQLKPETVSKSEVASQTRKKRFLGMPIPGTSSANNKSSSSH